MQKKRSEKDELVKIKTEKGSGLSDCHLPSATAQPPPQQLRRA